MNRLDRLDRLFNIDERVVRASPAQIRRRALLYTLVRPSQLRHVVAREATLRRKSRGGLPLDDGIPWITYDALRWLDTVVHPGMQVFVTALS